MIRIVFGAALLVFGSLAADAQQAFEFSGEDSVAGEGSTGRGASVDFAWKADFKIGTLLREPVVSTRFMFNLDGGVVTLPSSTARGKPAFETHKLSSLPQEAIAKVRLYDVKLRVDFDGISNDFFIESDVGQPGPVGEWSFNVPGSPDWGALFQYRRSMEGNRQYLSADAAKKEYLRGLEPTGAYIVSAHMTLWDLHQWYEVEHPLKTLEAYGAAIDHLQEGLHISYGYPRSVLDSGTLTELYAGTVNEQIELIEKHKERLAKLLDVPEFFRIGTNHRPYEIAAEQARKIRLAVTDHDQRIDSGSDQEILLEFSKRGRAPRFDDLGISMPAEEASDPAPQKAAGSGAKPSSDGRTTIPLDVCMVSVWKPCAVPYSDAEPRVIVADFHVEDIPADICANGDQIANYLPASGWFETSQDFPEQYAGRANSMLKAFKSNLENAHPQCRDGGIVYGLRIYPPGVHELSRTCSHDVDNLGPGKNINLCADF